MLRHSKPHGFVAWLFDAYFASFLLGAITALWLALQNSTGTMTLALTILGTSLLLSILYHTATARHVAWRSPGEMVAGRFVSSGSKHWLSPYRRTRWPLFAVMLLVTILAGNTWDGIGRGAELPPGKVALDIIALLVLVVGLVQVGQGRAWWMIAPAGYCALVAITALRATSSDVPVPAGVRIGVAAFFGLIGLLSLIAGAVYARLRPIAAPPAAA